MFILKKIVSRLLFPVPLCSEILLAGLVLLWFTRRQKAGKVLVSLGTLLFLLMGNRVLTSRLLRPLEHRYPPLDLTSDASVSTPASAAKFIVVLGGGHTSDPEIPVSSQLGEETTARLMEGIRVYRRMPGCRLILSGGAGFERLPEAEAMARVATQLGVNSQDILLESESLDTDDEARLIAPIVGKEPFILVTSASHMPRSMALFQKRGTNPIPDATDYLSWRRAKPSPDDLYPGYEGLYNITRTVYEYLGIAWAKLRNQA